MCVVFSINKSISPGPVLRLCESIEMLTLGPQQDIMMLNQCKQFSSTFSSMTQSSALSRVPDPSTTVLYSPRKALLKPGLAHMHSSYNSAYAEQGQAAER